MDAYNYYLSKKDYSECKHWVKQYKKVTQCGHKELATVFGMKMIIHLIFWWFNICTTLFLEIMGLYGIGKGLFKMAKGVITGDAEEIAKGGKKIAVNVIAGEILDRIHTDEDDND